MGRVLDILDEPVERAVPDILDEPVERAMPGVVETPAGRLSGRIEFEEVSFGYGDGTPALRDVSFTIEPGESIALLGPSGCGKTTVLALLLRFYDYESGSIRLDGRELRTIERRSLREQISAALQEPFMYSRTIEENILVGNTNAAPGEIRAAARYACIHDSIVKFENSYETMVGERGVTLSGGQRQRVSLARALVRDAPFLFLDDTLSAVDSETEQDILSALEKEGRTRTTLVVAHRLSTLSMADRIFVFEDGRLIGEGTQESLRNAPGLYRRLWRMQAELEASLARELE
jgi:ATP-binding cassette subfamily B protein